MKKILLVLFSPLLMAAFLAACNRDLSTAQGVVEEFLDQYYVHIDLQKAKGQTSGLATEKINEELRLTAGQAIDASTRKPKVHYRLLEKKEGAGRASFLYEGTIEVEDAATFTRRWIILARKEGERWKVSNFTEHD